MKATNTGGGGVPVPLPMPATTQARCYSVVDFGTAEHFYNGQSQGMQRRIYVTWELPEFTAVFVEGRNPEPFVIGQEMKLSTNEKATLALLVTAWRGYALNEEEKEGFPVEKMLGKNCIMSFELKVKTAAAGQQIQQYTNQNARMSKTSIAPIPNGLQEFAPMNQPILFDFDNMMVSGQFDLATFARLPKWQRERVEKAQEFQHFMSMGQVAIGQEFQREQPAAPPQQAAQQPMTPSEAYPAPQQPPQAQPPQATQPPQQAPPQAAPPQAAPPQAAQPAQAPPQAPPQQPPAGGQAPGGW